MVSFHVIQPLYLLYRKGTATMHYTEGQEVVTPICKRCILNSQFLPAPSEFPITLCSQSFRARSACVTSMSTYLHHIITALHETQGVANGGHCPFGSAPLHGGAPISPRINPCKPKRE